MNHAGKLLGAAALLLSACSAVDVRTDHDASVDFSRYSTYYWKRFPRTSNSLMDGRIVTAVDGQLFARGWRKVPEQQAQTALAASVTERDGQWVDTMHNNWGPGWQGWGMGGPMMMSARVVNYTVGTLVIDLYDVNSRNAVWRGTASDIISRRPETVRKSMEEGVRKMFARFPPGVASSTRPQ
ncbi:MAG: DUF4136 domain-containing protein [Methylotetracoccus sp.]|nr:DUF4136 domain-containing protein [Methylotetracoccus sp.]